MRKLFWGILLFTFQFQSAQNMKIPFELSEGSQTSTYFETIDFWKNLAEKSDKIQITEKGLTDSGFPLHLVLISNSGEFDLKKIQSENKSILLINNGIHPG